MKFENITIVILNRPLIFDGRRIEILAFDLKHINYGWNKNIKDSNLKKRSEYSVDDIIFIFNILTSYKLKFDTSNKLDITFNQKNYIRYIIKLSDPWSDKIKKVVIDIDLEALNKAIIVTIY